MNHEKKYKEALERAKKLKENPEIEIEHVYDYIFPELRECDDETIRTTLVHYFKNWSLGDPYWKDIYVQEIIDWLVDKDERRSLEPDAEKRGVTWADSHPCWISVADELPHAEQENATNLGAFLFYTEPIDENGSFEGRYRTGFYNSVTGTYEIIPDQFGNTRVTHWMPLPPPVVSKSDNAHIIGTAEHIQVALDVIDKKGGEE